MSVLLRRERLVVHWLGGGLFLDRAGEGLLVDVPAGAADLLRAAGALSSVRSVLLTSGRVRAVEGLVPLLCALEPLRDDSPLPIRTCLGEERGPTLASAWTRAWPDRYPLLLDALAPGSEEEIGAFSIRTIPLRHGEPRWRTGTVEPAVAVAVRVTVPEGVIAWVPGAAPSPAVRRACRGADLAVVEVGVEPWPQTPEPWRLTLEEALRDADEAGEAWLVGDDGRFLGGEDQ